MGGLPINMLDFIFGAILIFLTVRGVFNGFLREVATLVGLLLGFFMANRLYLPVLPYAQKIFTDPGYAKIASYLLVLCGTFIVVIIGVTILRNLFQLAALGGIDRVVGGFVGFLKGAVLCAIILLVLTTFLSPGNETLTTSSMAPQINRLTGTLASMLPQSMREQFREKGSELQELWAKDWAKEIRSKNTDK